MEKMKYFFLAIFLICDLHAKLIPPVKKQNQQKANNLVKQVVSQKVLGGKLHNKSELKQSDLKVQMSNKQKIKINTLSDILKNYPQVTYQKCHDAQLFNYKPFDFSPHSDYHPSKGVFTETFVVTIPQGKVLSGWGYVLVDNTVIKESISQNTLCCEHLDRINGFARNSILQKMEGKVVVLTHIGHVCFCHWILEVIGRLALLQMHNVEYDWLYIPYKNLYVQKTLSLLGIDSSKIIDVNDDENKNIYIQADILIFPSMTDYFLPCSRDRNFDSHITCGYCPTWNIKWLRNTFLPLAQNSPPVKSFSKRIFISRKDSDGRQATNEDELFDYFKQYGFERYELNKLPYEQQVALFAQAEIVVGVHGAGLSNIVYCNPEAVIIEVLQKRYDATFWYLAQEMNLKHYVIKTVETNFAKVPTPQEVESTIKMDTYIPIDVVQQYFIDHNVF